MDEPLPMPISVGKRVMDEPLPDQLFSDASLVGTTKQCKKQKLAIVNESIARYRPVGRY